MPRAHVRSRAPGRVNLIGEHTDYNDGFVLPMALPFATTIDARTRDDGTVRLRSDGYGDTRFSLEDDPAAVGGWARYVAGMLRYLAEDGVAIGGLDASITTTIPVGASLSSSAAFEVATGFAVAALAGIDPDPVRIALLGQRVENSVIGIQSGIMDQLISATAVEGSATLIDCRDLTIEPTPLPGDGAVLIMDTMTRRELADSEYDRRRASCERAAAAIGVASLREAERADLEAVDDTVDRRRALHVISENTRVLDAVDAMRAGNCAHLGGLMNESHRSLRDDYEVSSEALDAITAHARDHDACFGARMTGGGFAGCAVALVRADAATDVAEHVRAAYAESHGARSDIWDVRPAAGAAVEVLA